MKMMQKTALILSALFVTMTVHAQTGADSATVYENVRVFNGTADKLSGPTNVLVVGNTIKSISNKSIDVPAGLNVTRIAGDGRTLMLGLIDAC